MTRRGAAIGESRPQPGAAGGRRDSAGGPSARLIKHLRPYAPSIAGALVILALMGLTLEYLQAERARVLATAARELDLRASALAHSLDETLSASPGLGPIEALRAVLAANPDLRPSQ